MANETLFQLLTRQPWWISALVAAFLFAIAQLIYAPIAPFVALPFLVIAAYVGYLQLRGVAGANVEKELEQLREMSWESFSAVVADAYRSQGYQVQASRDRSYDFVLTKNGKRTLVLARRWKVHQVGVGPLRELADAIARADAYNGICIASGAYTENARTYAQGQPLSLLAGEELADLVTNARKRNLWSLLRSRIKRS